MRKGKDTIVKEEITGTILLTGEVLLTKSKGSLQGPGQGRIEDPTESPEDIMVDKVIQAEGMMGLAPGKDTIVREEITGIGIVVAHMAGIINKGEIGGVMKEDMVKEVEEDPGKEGIGA